MAAANSGSTGFVQAGDSRHVRAASTWGGISEYRMMPVCGCAYTGSTHRLGSVNISPSGTAMHELRKRRTVAGRLCC